MPPNRNKGIVDYGSKNSPEFGVRAGRASNRDKFVVKRWDAATYVTELNDREHKLRFPVGFDGVQTLANDATPSVLGGGAWQTGGTTTITDFDDGVVGDILYIEAKHSVTITHGSPIQLNGDANYDMVSGDTLVLQMFDDQVWVEMARGGQAGSTSTVGKAATLIIGPSSNSDSDTYDYVTDGTADDVQIQAAIDALESGAGGRIIFREGTYVISSTISITASDDDLILEGMGRSTILQAGSTLNSEMIGHTTGTVERLVIKNFYFDGNSSGQSADTMAIDFSGVAGNPLQFVIIENCEFEDFYDNCANISDATVGIVRDCSFINWAQTTANGRALHAQHIINCYFTTTSTTGLFVSVSFDGTMLGSYLLAPENWNGTSMIAFGSGGNQKVLGNQIEGSGGFGSSATMVQIASVNNIVIHGNTFDSSAGENAASIGIDASTGGSDIRVTGNYFQSLGYAIYFPSANSDNCVISDNVILNSSTTGIRYDANYGTISGNSINNSTVNGIYIESDDNVISGNAIEGCGQEGIYITGATSNIITGNLVKNAGETTNNTYDAIFIDTGSDRNIITGNRVRATSANVPRYGINISNSTCDNNIVSNNIVTDASTGQINDAGTGTVTDGSNVTS